MKTLFYKLINSSSHWLLLFILISNSIKAQFNLVPNYSFENYTICPNFNSFGSPPPFPWYLPNSVNYQWSTYFNSCSTTGLGVPYNSLGGFNNSYQLAKNGQAYELFVSYADFDNNSRSYIQTKLKDSLKNGKFYYVEFFISLGNSSKYGSNNSALLFTKNAIHVDTTTNPNQFQILPANPQVYNYDNPIIQDTLNWIRVSSIYKAQGGEQYITIGNFKDDTQTQIKYFDSTNNSCACAQYYVDDVSVIPLDSFCLKADAGRDTTIKVGDSVFIGSNTNGIDTIKWFNGSGQLIDSIRPGFWYTPSTTGISFFILQQTVNGCYSSDTIYINAVLPLNFISYNCVPSLRGTKQSLENTWTTANEVNVSHYNIQRSINAKDFTTIGTVKANNKQQNNYTYTDELTPNTQHQTWFYRIAGVDYDGRKTYSTTKQITLKLQTPNNVFVFPNPAKDVVNIVSKSIKEVKLINYLGQQIATGTYLRNDAIIINTKNFNNGLYIVQIITQNGDVKNEKLIIK